MAGAGVNQAPGSQLAIAGLGCGILNISTLGLHGLLRGYVSLGMRQPWPE
jgi:hypothetical protein